MLSFNNMYYPVIQSSEAEIPFSFMSPFSSQYQPFKAPALERMKGSLPGQNAALGTYAFYMCLLVYEWPVIVVGKCDVHAQCKTWDICVFLHIHCIHAHQFLYYTYRLPYCTVSLWSFHCLHGLIVACTDQAAAKARVGSKIQSCALLRSGALLVLKISRRNNVKNKTSILNHLL